MRNLEDALAMWREAERRVQRTEPGTTEGDAARAEVERRREDYQSRYADVEEAIENGSRPAVQSHRHEATA
jgi:hypothetical protein